MKKFLAFFAAFLLVPVLALADPAPFHITGNLHLDGVGFGVLLKQGTNARTGTFICNGVTPVTVANTTTQISDIIDISLNTVGGTVGAEPHLATITATTGFTVVCTASDTSTYNYSMTGVRP